MASFPRFTFHAASLAAVALLAGAPAWSQQDRSVPDAPLAAVVHASNRFALDFYRDLSAHEAGQNIFVSPYSVSTALAMACEGSRKETRSQMAAVLHLDLPDAKRRAGYSALLAGTNPGEGKTYKLEVANALWGQKDFHFEPAFTSALKDSYGGGFNLVDFAGSSEASRGTINAWVEQKTAGKIRDLIHPSDLTPLTRLVLTNAIYFKSAWASPFKKQSTQTADFHVTASKAVPVPMMALSERFLFVRRPGVAAIELPYAGNDLSMVVILPDGDIDAFGASLSLDSLQKLRSEMKGQQVDLSLPRFKFETRSYLEQVLSRMGMPDAFNAKRADFSGMTGKPNLSISHVIHQAMINVDEEGTEAAAATAVIMSLKAMRVVERESFRADRPFLFLIVHNPTGSILFMGRVSDPSK